MKMLSTGDAGRRSAFSPVPLRLPTQPTLQPQPAREPQALQLSYKGSSETVLLVDEEEDEDDIIEITSPFPLGQCSRTSPGNHATIRR